MSWSRRPHALVTLLALVLCAFVAPLRAQAPSAYPDHPVRILVPFPPGGPADALARLVAEELGQSLSQPFVVENKPGAGGNIGMEQGGKAAPDGYTLILAPVGNLTVSPYIYSRLPYDPQKDFVPVTVLAAVPNILIVNASVPARSMRELIALAKARPGALNFASPGNGSGAHLAGELLKRMAGIDLVHVPYNGVAPAMNGVLAGDVQLFFAQSSVALPQIKGGRVVPIGVASLKRIDAAPELPTLAESGLPGFDVTSWYSLVAPAGTPAARIDRIQAAVARAFARPEVRERIAGLGAEAVADTPAQFAALWKAESARWQALARDANIHAD